MRGLYRKAVSVMEDSFRRLEAQTPKPDLVSFRGGSAYRYSQQSVGQAILLKLARYISGMNAADLLLANGFVQELAVLQRTLDEIQEDIFFLGIEPPSSGEGSSLRRDYLKRFWEEEFDEGVAPMDSTKGRYPISRGKIRTYIERQFHGMVNDKGEKASAVLHQTYSGFVHAAAPFLMEMCEGQDRTFLLNGLLGTHRIAEHMEDFWNQHYRGLLVVRVAAIAFGDTDLANELSQHMEKFEKLSGSNIMADVRAEMAK